MIFIKTKGTILEKFYNKYKKWMDKQMSAQFFFNDFWEKSWEWSKKTFGTIEQRNAFGPLDHLKKEVTEIELELLSEDDRGELLTEIVDAFLLVQDIAKRAGFTVEEFREECWRKLEENKKRKWPPIDSMPNKAAEHIKE